MADSSVAKRFVRAIDGPTHWINEVSLPAALIEFRCRRPEQCTEEFLTYGVTKFWTESEAGRPCDPVTLRLIGYDRG